MKVYLIKYTDGFAEFEVGDIYASESLARDWLKKHIIKQFDNKDIWNFVWDKHSVSCHDKKSDMCYQIIGQEVITK